MMWAATVRRCPTGHRHPSQFGARLQLARALTHAPYLICDGVYSCPTTIHSHLNQEVNLPYRLSNGDETNIVCGERISECERENSGRTTPYLTRNDYNPGDHSSSRNYGRENISRSRSSVSSYMSRNRFDADEVRVELPYSRRELELQDDYSLNERIVRRYDDFQGREDTGDEGVVGLSYQQRSMGNSGPYREEVWGSEPSMDCWGDRPLLIKRGKTRELVRTMFVVALSFTLVSFVIMGFEMYNMVIRTIFIFFLLSSLFLLIFLMIRRATCLPCCEEAPAESTGVEESENQQQRIEDFPRETSEGILKKRLSDSPPPYESPPDYNSLPPEILVNARGLSGLETIANALTKVHGEQQQQQQLQSHCSQQKENCKKTTRRSRMNFHSSSSPFLSTSSALFSEFSTTRSSLPTSTSLCTNSETLKVNSSKEQSIESNPINLSSSSSSLSPPPYDCVVLQPVLTKEEKPC